MKALSEEKKEKIRELKIAHPDWGYRRIGRETRVHYNTVGKILKEQGLNQPERNPKTNPRNRLNAPLKASNNITLAENYRESSYPEPFDMEYKYAGEINPNATKLLWGILIGVSLFPILPPAIEKIGNWFESWKRKKDNEYYQKVKNRIDQGEALSQFEQDFFVREYQKRHPEKFSSEQGIIWLSPYYSLCW
jgi:hypothetical protein